MPKRKRKLASAKDIKTIKAVHALRKHSTIQEAYAELHPNASENTVKKNAKNILTPEVVEAFKEAMEIDNLATANRVVLEKALFTVVALWYAGRETTQNLIAAIRELTKLVPEWSEKIQIQDSEDEETIKAKLRELGFDPDAIRRN